MSQQTFYFPLLTECNSFVWIWNEYFPILTPKTLFITTVIFAFKDFFTPLFNVSLYLFIFLSPARPVEHFVLNNSYWIRM